jgi:hypothetical protein
MHLCLNLRNFRKIMEGNRMFFNEKYLLLYLNFMDILRIQIIKYFFLVTNNIPNSFKNVLANTFLKEFEVKISTMLSFVIDIVYNRQQDEKEYNKDNFNKCTLILFIKMVFQENILIHQKFNEIHVSYFLQGMRIEFEEDEAENILDIFFYNKESLIFMDDFTLKTTLLEELLAAKFDFYIEKVLEKERIDIFYRYLPLDYEEPTPTLII